MRAAVERGYAVVVQDVRGRYRVRRCLRSRIVRRDATGSTASNGWRRSPGAIGRVAGSGLSYPGAVQWLAAVESPPHLACIFPAMCFSSARHFFYVGGAFDLSWIPWIANNIAPEERRRRSLPGPRTGREARAEWARVGRSALRHRAAQHAAALEGCRSLLLRVARPSGGRSVLGLCEHRGPPRSSAGTRR